MKSLHDGRTTINTAVENDNYQITLTDMGIDSTYGDNEINSFYNAFFNLIQRKLKFMMISRKFYDAKDKHPLTQHQCEVLKG